MILPPARFDEPHRIPMTARLAAIYRYPVKGLSADRIETVDLVPGEALPFDRAYAIENGPGRFDPFNPRHVPKVNFLMLMRNAGLATLQTSFDDATQTLSIVRGGGRVADGCLTTPTGRAIIAQFFAEYMKDDLRGPPRVVHAAGHSISDVSAKCLHIINLASVAELERVVGQPINPLRFRPNLVVTGAPAWAEFGWVKQKLKIADAELKVFDRTERCAATNVDPATGRRDLDIPAVLLRNWGHSDFGVYARVTSPGRIAPYAPLTVM
jgi:uncharacterized protein YcbX